MSAELSQTSRRTSTPLSAPDIDEAAQRISGVVGVTPAAVQRSVVGPRSGAGLPQARGSAGRPLLQAARRLQPADAADARGDRRRRGVLVGRQPRAGLRTRLPVDGHPRPRVRARQDTEAEARPHPLPRRRVHRADRRRSDLRRRGRGRARTTSRGPAPPWCRRTTTSAPWPARAPSPSRSWQQLEVEPDLVIVPVGGGGCISGITTYLAERTTEDLGARRRAGRCRVDGRGTGHR